MRFAALMAVLIVAGCGAPPEKQGARACGSASQAQVQEVFTGWTRAYEARNIEGVMSIFAPDVVFEFEGQAKQSYADLERGFRADFAQADRADKNWVAEPDTIMLSGNMANVISTWRLQENGRTREKNRAANVLQRGADCRWRIVRSLNYRVRE